MLTGQPVIPLHRVDLLYRPKMLKAASRKVIIHLIDRDFVVIAVSSLIVQVLEHALKLLGLFIFLGLELLPILFLLLDLRLESCGLLFELFGLARGHALGHRFLLRYIVLLKVINFDLQCLVDHLSLIDLVDNAIKVHRFFDFSDVLLYLLSLLLLLDNDLLQPDQLIALLFQVWIHLCLLVVLIWNSSSHRYALLLVLSMAEICILLHHKLNILQQIPYFLTKLLVQICKRLGSLLPLHVKLHIQLRLPILGHCGSLLHFLIYDQEITLLLVEGSIF